MHALQRIVLVTTLLMLVILSAEAGAKVLFEESFETGAVDPTKAHLIGEIRLTTENFHSGKYSLKITYPRHVNETSGRLELNDGIITQDMKTFFVRWYEVFNLDFDFPEGLKQWRFFSGIASGPLVYQELQFVNAYMRVISIPTGIPEDSVKDGPVSVGAWHCYEAQVVLNDLPSVANGIMRLWVDSELKAEKTNVIMRTDVLERKGFIGFWIGGNYSDAVSAGGTGGPLVDSVLFLDDIVISTERIGCLPDMPDKTAPAPPTGVRITSP